jgi:hypothetical protein
MYIDFETTVTVGTITGPKCEKITDASTTPVTKADWGVFNSERGICINTA